MLKKSEKSLHLSLKLVRKKSELSLFESEFNSGSTGGCFYVECYPADESQTDMGDKCRRYVADPNIGCFQASRCGAIAYRGKMF